jgi:hypothetical protein
VVLLLACVLLAMAGVPSKAAALTTATGQLYAFGDNRFGQLGSTTNSGTVEANPTPALVTLPGATGPVTQVAAGDNDSLAVTATGELYAFGANEGGQLGSTTNSGTDEPNPTPALLALGAGTTLTVARGPAANHTLVLVAELAVSSATLPAGQVAVPYGATAAAAGGSVPYRWSAAGLPAGLSINPASGQITGTPTSAGSANVTLTVADAYGLTASSAMIALTIAPPATKATAQPTGLKRLVRIRAREN